ncbi:MAG: ribonuclease P protein component [Ruminococcaceae bacterium]|nr:ribonuclease P protein component [Oscillospiraceae bacterium]
MAKIVPIKENHLFSKVYAKGKKASEKNIAVYVLNNYKTNETRLGITTGKKLGNAVQRSRARRLIREAYRLLLKKYNFQRPYLIVVVARNAIVDDKRKMDAVFYDMEKAFLKLQAFSEDNKN